MRSLAMIVLSSEKIIFDVFAKIISLWNSFNAILLSGLAAKISLRYVKALPPLEAEASVECRLACLVKVSTVDCWSWDGRPRDLPDSLPPWRPAKIKSLQISRLFTSSVIYYSSRAEE